MNSLLLDTQTWDLCKDAFGNIAMCSEPYAVAQDVACEARTFLGECYYDTTRGIPYFQQILGKFPAPSFIKAQYVAAAQTVPLVVSAKCFLTGLTGRVLSGQIQVTDSNGGTQVVGF